MKNKRIITVMVAVCAVVAVALCSIYIFDFNTKAQVIFEETNPELKFKVYDSKPSIGSADWKGEGEFSQFDGEKYNIKTNTHCMWWEVDDIAFAYKNYVAAYGDQGTITVETTILSRDLYKGAVLESNASTGIAIRDMDSADSPSVYLHCRGDWVGVVYRTKQGQQTVLATDDGAVPKYPVRLKLVKTGNAVKSFYLNNGGEWTGLGTVYVKMDDTVMAGVAAHCLNGADDWITTDFTDFKVTVEGPEGSVYDQGDGGGTDSDSSGTESVEENKLPPDPALTDNILFRETFTDGSLVNPTEENENEIENPIWESENGDPQYAEIVTDGDNRYWHRRFNIDEYYFPNNEWTDYSMSTDIKFGDETIADGINQLNFFVRLRAMDAYGYFGYRIELTYGKYLKIHKYFAASSPMSDNVIAQKTLDTSYILKDWNTWKIDAFDNEITVSLNGKKLLSVVDDGKGDNSTVSFGGIGIASDGADFYIDNVLVRKTEDLMGGDYDNKIAGNWDDDIPDYLKNFKGAY